jgi:hypothetical protein
LLHSSIAVALSMLTNTRDGRIETNKTLWSYACLEFVFSMFPKTVDAAFFSGQETIYTTTIGFGETL